MRYSPGSLREAHAEQNQFGDWLWNEYRLIYGNEAADDPNLHYAVEYAMSEAKWRGKNPMRAMRESPHEFLIDVDLARQCRHGVPSNYEDDSGGRTAGISGGGAAGQPQQQEAPDMIRELHAWQRAKGIY